MPICGHDPDELFAYPTPKIVIVKDRYLGLMRMSLEALIFLYIFVFTILYNGVHLQKTDLRGLSRLILRHPTKQTCDPFLVGCEANFTPMTELPYCSQSSMKYTARDGSEADKMPCQYWDYVESVMHSDGGLFVPTRVRKFQQKRGCVPSEANGWQCDDNGNVLYNFEDSDVVGGVQTFDDGKLHEAAPLYDVFLGDVEHFTVLMDHGFHNSQGVQLNDFSMDGYWLQCPSKDAPTPSCERHAIVCGHSDCPRNAASPDDLKAEQQVGGGLLPGVFQGFPAASNRLGDIFDIDSMLKMAHVSLDDLVDDGVTGTRRKNGMVLVIKVEYTNTHDRSWLGLRITPFSNGPQPTYSYRMSATAAASYRITKTYNDPADVQRIIRVYNGIRIVLEQSGSIASWSMSQFLVTFTAALGLLAASTTITELVMLNFMRRRDFYSKKKFAHTVDLNNPNDSDSTGDGEGTVETNQAVDDLMDGLDSADKQLVYEALDRLVDDMVKKKDAR